MKKILATLISVITMTIVASAATPSESTYSQSAKVIICNRSEYTITVKVMKSEGGLHSTVCLSPRSSRTVSFPKSGNFYTKRRDGRPFTRWAASSTCIAKTTATQREPSSFIFQAQAEHPGSRFQNRSLRKTTNKYDNPLHHIVSHNITTQIWQKDFIETPTTK